MPSNSTSPHWYSWDMGPAHFIRSAQHGNYIWTSLVGIQDYLICHSYSTEVYFYSYFSGWGVSEQMKWLQEDLAAAASPQNRAQRPWIIAYGHRPMYCSNRDFNDCTTPKSVVRAGYAISPTTHLQSLTTVTSTGLRHCSTRRELISF